MGLESVCIDWGSILFDSVDEAYTFVNIVLNGVVIIVDQDGLGPAFTCHFKGFCHKGIVAIVITTKCCHDIVGFTIFATACGIARMVRVVAGSNSFVYHVDHFEIGKIFFDLVEPLRNGLSGVINAHAIQPIRVLGPPNQGMELKMASVVYGPVIGSFAAAKIILTAGAFNGCPLALVFGSNLVPVGTEVVTNGTISRNVTYELGGTVSKAGACVGNGS